MLPTDTEISPKILSKSSPKPPKWHPRPASGALPHNCVLNYRFLPHFGAILELISEHLLLTFGTFFNKKTALESSRISNTFFWILRGIWGGPTCNPIEPARSKHMSALFPTSHIFIDISMGLGSKMAPKPSPKSI